MFHTFIVKSSKLLKLTFSHSLIINSASGEKFEKGNDWNVKVVNHVWLEECFQTWSLQSETKPRYSIFPVHHQLPMVFGAKISPESLDIWTTLDDETLMRSRSKSEEDTSKSDIRAADGAQEQDSSIDKLQGTLRKERGLSQDRETLPVSTLPANDNQGDSQDREILAASVTPTNKSQGSRMEDGESSQDREASAASVNEQDNSTTLDDKQHDVSEPSSPKPIKKRPTPVWKRRASDTTAISTSTTDSHSASPSVTSKERHSPTPLASGRESPAAGSTRVLGKRGAAVEASKALQKIVPDMNEFQEELRDEKRASKNKRKKYSAAEEHRDEDDSMDMDVDEAQTVASPRKTQLSSPAKRKRPSLVNAEVQGTPARSEDDDAANESETTASDPKLATKKARRAGKLNKSATGAVAIGHVDVTAGTLEHGAAPGTQPSKVKQVRYISTGLKEQSTKQVKALRALGIVPTTSVEKCTHLVAKNIARTEKFLVALAQGKTIVHEDWFQACIEANAILGKAASF